MAGTINQPADTYFSFAIFYFVFGMHWTLCVPTVNTHKYSSHTQMDLYNVNTILQANDLMKLVI